MQRVQPVGAERRSHGRGHRPVIHRAQAIAARETGPESTADLQRAGIAVGGGGPSNGCTRRVPTHAADPLLSATVFRTADRCTFTADIAQCPHAETKSLRLSFGTA